MRPPYVHIWRRSSRASKPRARVLGVTASRGTCEPRERIWIKARCRDMWGTLIQLGDECRTIMRASWRAQQHEPDIHPHAHHLAALACSKLLYTAWRGRVVS